MPPSNQHKLTFPLEHGAMMMVETAYGQLCLRPCTYPLEGNAWPLGETRHAYAAHNNAPDSDPHTKDEYKTTAAASGVCANAPHEHAPAGNPATSRS